MRQQLRQPAVRRQQTLVRQQRAPAPERPAMQVLVLPARELRRLLEPAQAPPPPQHLPRAPPQPNFFITPPPPRIAAPGPPPESPPPPLSSAGRRRFPP